MRLFFFSLIKYTIYIFLLQTDIVDNMVDQISHGENKFGGDATPIAEPRADDHLPNYVAPVPRRKNGRWQPLKPIAVSLCPIALHRFLVIVKKLRKTHTS